MLEAGRIAPEFSLKDLGNVDISLRENLKEGPALVVFFKISCPTCQLTLPFIERLKDSVRVIGVSQDDAKSTKEFLEYFQITFPVLIDPKKEGYAVSGNYQLTNVPSMFLIERNGQISWALSGFHKADLEALGERFELAIFDPSDRVPVMKPG